MYENRIYSGIQITRLIAYIRREFLNDIATSDPCEEVISSQYSLKFSNPANVTLPKTSMCSNAMTIELKLIAT